MNSTKYPRKILLITPHTLPETSGSGLNAFRFAQFLINKELKASVLSLNRNLKYKWKETIHQVPICRIPYYNKGLLLKILSIPLVSCFYFIQILRNEMIIIYGGKTFAFEMILIMARLFRRKLVFQSLLLGVDDMDQMIGKRSWCTRKIYHSLFALPDTYFAINPEFSHQYHRWYPGAENILESSQGVDTENFQPVDEVNKSGIRERLHLPLNKPLLLSVGFMLQRKGYDELIKCLANLEMDFCYCVVGDHEIGAGHFLSPLTTEIDRLKQMGNDMLGNKIIYHAFTDQIEAYYQCADVFILNSYQEGLPNVLLEAMATGIPILCRRMTGIDDSLLINRYNSLLYNNIEELIKLLKDLISDKELQRRLSENALDDIHNKHSFERVFKKLIEAKELIF